MKKNFLLLLASIVFVTLLLIVPGYSFISTKLPNDSRFIFLHWRNTTEQKDELRFSTTFRYLNYLVSHTPPNAIIIMPPDSVLLSKNSSLKFLKQVTEKQWASYFVYPRKLVYEKEKGSNPLYEKATHIAVVNGWGLNKISYDLSEKMETGVVPINP